MNTYDDVLEVLDALPILVREKRRREGLSLREAETASGVDHSAIRRLELGMEDARFRNVRALLAWVSS